MRPYLLYHRLRQRLRDWSERGLFGSLCQEYKIRIASPTGPAEIAVFKDIFLHKAYADWFPFYRRARVVDVGAHKGFFSLFAARCLAPDSRIVALEPNSRNFADLDANIRANGFGQMIQAWRCGIGRSAGKARLHLSSSENHSLHPAAGVSGKGVSETVDLVGLGDVLERTGWDQVDFLKLDCEGAEYEALYQTPPRALERVRVISMEFHDLKAPETTGLAMAEFLAGRGFSIVKLHHETTRLPLHTGKLIAIRS